MKSRIQRSTTTKREKTPLVLLQSPLAVLAITVLFLIALISLQNSKRQAAISEASLKQLEQETKQLEQQAAQSQIEFEQKQQEIAREKVIRNELLEQKEGEIVLQVPEKEQVSDSENQPSKKSNPFEEWKSLLRGDASN